MLKSPSTSRLGPSRLCPLRARAQLLGGVGGEALQLGQAVGGQRAVADVRGEQGEVLVGGAEAGDVRREVELLGHAYRQWRRTISPARPDSTTRRMSNR